MKVFTGCRARDDYVQIDINRTSSRSLVARNLAYSAPSDLAASLAVSAWARAAARCPSSSAMRCSRSATSLAASFRATFAQGLGSRLGSVLRLGSGWVCGSPMVEAVADEEIVEHGSC